MDKFSTLHIVRPSFRLGLWSWVMLHLSYQSYRIHQSVQWRIHACAMPWSYVCHDVFMCAMTGMCVPWFVYACTMTYSCVFPDLFMCVPWRIYECAIYIHASTIWRSRRPLPLPSKCDMTHCVSHASLPLPSNCDANHSPVWHDFLKFRNTRVASQFEQKRNCGLFFCQRSFTAIFKKIALEKWRDSCMQVTWLLFESWHISHLDVQHDSFKWWHALSMSVPWFLEITTWLVYACAMTLSNRDQNLCAQHEFIKWRHALCMSGP